MKLKVALLAASVLVGAPASAADTIKWAHWYDKSVLGATDRSEVLQPCQGACSQQVVQNVSSHYVLGFETNNQYQNALIGRNFIPPDTMGAVGTSQYMVTLNGSIGVYDKYTGAALSFGSDVNFWNAAFANSGTPGLTGTAGDPRIMFNADMNRWVTIAFGANTKDIQIGVSDTDNALGSWKAVRFEGYAGLPNVGGGIADYPTLAMDGNAIYIGTNDFAPNAPGGGATFKGTTLNVIPIDSIFAASGPSVANMKKFVSPLSAGFAGEGGYAIQGVNSSAADGTGTVFSASLYVYDTLSYDISGLSSSSATGGTKTATIYSGDAGYTGAGPARQPADIAANRRIIDTLDDRVSSSVYEHNGYIFAVHTVDPTGDVGDYARVRVVVIDAVTKALVDTYDIGSGAYDYYQGSLAINEQGRIVVGFNRSGLSAADGTIRFSAVILSADASGQLHQHGGEILLKESLTNDYHNGSLKGQAAAGRQRWGDYSQVSLDPTNSNRFYAIGEFAREYNTPADGHPGGTGGSRWSTWVAVIDVAGVPEPST
ncbi:MAG: hypothetical protein EON59_12625, partial [Alphaproteobacteria bacterium]